MKMTKCLFVFFLITTFVYGADYPGQGLTHEDISKIENIHTQLFKAQNLTSAEILELQELLINHSNQSLNHLNSATEKYKKGQLSSWALEILSILEDNNQLYNLLYRKNSKLRRVAKGVYRDRNMNKDVKNIIEINDLIIRKIDKKQFIDQLDFLNSYNLSRVVENPLAQKILKNRNISRLNSDGLNDAVFDSAKNLTTAVSFFVGNIATPARIRNGYLYHDQTAIQTVKTKLRPMDLILSSCPYTLSSQMIPGFFTHGAIYLGTKEQLLEIGMWNHPSIIPYQKQIEQGKTILQALITGVELGTVEEYLNIDSVLVMRKDNALSDLDVVEKQIKIGMSQMGKGYDYNFDITTPDKILCTELISMMYPDVQFKNKRELGFITITPNAIAENLFEHNSKFKMVEFYSATSKNNKQSQDIEHLRLAVFKH